jgi:hypothetical protein
MMMLVDKHRDRGETEIPVMVEEVKEDYMYRT